MQKKRVLSMNRRLVLSVVGLLAIFPVNQLSCAGAEVPQDSLGHGFYFASNF
jgi:hypothetical protein